MKKLWHVRSLSVLASLLLLLILAACGGAATPTEQSPEETEPTATSEPTPTPSPTPEPTTATTGSTFSGDGYTISYPEGWQQSGSGALLLVTEASSQATATVAAGADGGQPAEAQVDAYIQGLGTSLENVQKDGAITDVSHADTTWKRQGYTAEKSGMQFKGYVLVAVYQGKAYVIGFLVSADKFDQYETEYFQPMWQSFKFA